MPASAAVIPSLSFRPFIFLTWHPPNVFFFFQSGYRVEEPDNVIWASAKQCFLGTMTSGGALVEVYVGVRIPVVHVVSLH